MIINNAFVLTSLQVLIRKLQTNCLIAATRSSVWVLILLNFKYLFQFGASVGRRNMTYNWETFLGDVEKIRIGFDPIKTWINVKTEESPFLFFWRLKTIYNS